MAGGVGLWVRANRGISAHLSPSLKTGLYLAYPTEWGGLFGSGPNEVVGGVIERDCVRPGV